MDNLCHTLVGAALGEAGLKRRTPLATATLLIGANFPDIDVIAVPLGHSLEFRRGWTHGVLALVVLPFVLTALMLAWDKLMRRRRGDPQTAPAYPRALLLLSAISILTHPTLDWMNVYGMRWLMPFSDRWFYGDVLFIIDPWIWLALAVGVWLSRRRARGAHDKPLRPARVALGAVSVYIAAMLVLALAGRRAVAAQRDALGVRHDARIMVGPVPVSPWRREVVFDEGSRYRFGSLDWVPEPRLRMEPLLLPRNVDAATSRAAAATSAGRAFLSWARFPFFITERGSTGTVVRIGDARYTRDARQSFAATVVRLP
ncbi:MAG TPA: metal-dependent hydrolase [Gemmatimonadaceae bacterium]|nr:metal-dependent hydrolase [Gemmatimonadaceae bacterium]